MALSPLDKLVELRTFGGERRTLGLKDEVVARFLHTDPSLGQAIDEAWQAHRVLREEESEALAGSEADLVTALQEGLVQFYPAPTVNPYVPLAARGPWLITSHGAVLHDSGGYGMLGMGHAPPRPIAAMAQPWVMANVMTPSFSQKRLVQRLRAEVGHTRGGCPFSGFVCLNSGSESVTIASRITDVNAARMTGPGGRHEGRKVKFLAQRRAFHGRTDRPAQVSDSSRGAYVKNLKSFQELDNLLLVEPNSVEGLEEVFADAEASGVFIEAMFLEPVQGEGNPGLQASRAFYDAARRLTAAHGSLLIIDSIQAGLRSTGCLSIVDYPGFEDAEPPDMETYSKALNAGQFPLSVLAMTQRAADLYVVGIYGNTMTTNPRALEVAVSVLDSITPELRRNIRDRGDEFVSRLSKLADELPGVITKVQGTGLLLSAELDPERFPVIGFGGVEEYCRVHGVGIIHGGRNALRLTPHFAITSAEIDVVLEVIADALHQVYV